jgi:hypothetical protein
MPPHVLSCRLQALNLLFGSAAAIIIGVVVGVVVIGLAIAIYFLYCQKRRKSSGVAPAP